jgi:hypothetical protein
VTLDHKTLIGGLNNSIVKVCSSTSFQSSWLLLSKLQLAKSVKTCVNLRPNSLPVSVNRKFLHYPTYHKEKRFLPLSGWGNSCRS